MKKRGKFLKKKKKGDFSRLTLFQKPGLRSSKKCPLSGPNAPVVDYKNVKLLKSYISENGKILPSRITSVSQGKQRKLNNEIKKAKILGLI